MNGAGKDEWLVSQRIQRQLPVLQRMRKVTRRDQKEFLVEQRIETYTMNRP